MSADDPIAAVRASAAEAAEVAPAPPGVPDGLVELLDDQWRSDVAATVARLRGLADRIEQRGGEGPRQSLRDLKPDYTDSAAEIIGSIEGLVGNLHLGRFANHARDADLAVRGVSP